MLRTWVVSTSNDPSVKHFFASGLVAKPTAPKNVKISVVKKTRKANKMEYDKQYIYKRSKDRIEWREWIVIRNGVITACKPMQRATSDFPRVAKFEFSISHHILILIVANSQYYYAFCSTHIHSHPHPWKKNARFAAGPWLGNLLSILLNRYTKNFNNCCAQQYS